MTRHSDATRRKISEARRRADAERLPEAPLKLRRCPRCKLFKDTLNDFGTRRYVTKTGIVVFHPRDCCRTCDTQRQQAYKARKLAEDPQGYVAARRAIGARSNHRRRHPDRPRVSARPLLTWWDDLPPGDRPSLPDALGRALLRSRTSDELPLDVVDAILVLMSREDLLTTLYPPED